MFNKKTNKNNEVNYNNVSRSRPKNYKEKKKPVRQNNKWLRGNNNELRFFGLGGLRSFMFSCYVYEYNGKFIIVDYGIGGFGGSDMHTDFDTNEFVDLSFFKGKEHLVEGLFVTHNHADHSDALIYLHKTLRCPVFATPIVKKALENECQLAKLNFKRIINFNTISPKGNTTNTKNFSVTGVSISHSIPESLMFHIETKAGAVLHTGDFKFSKNSLAGENTNTKYLKSLKSKKLLAIIGESTDVLSQWKRGKTELDVAQCLTKLFSSTKKRIVLTRYARAVNRINAIEIAAYKSNRKIVLIGLSINQYYDIANELGYLKYKNLVISREEAEDYHDSELVYCLSGTQGEQFSGLQRTIFQPNRNDIQLSAGRDLVLFSSRVIPGNDTRIASMYEELIDKGIEFKTYHLDNNLHTGGHDISHIELIDFYKTVNPATFIPMHGTLMHMIVNKMLADKAGIRHTILPHNGDVVALSHNKAPRIIASVPTDTIVQTKHFTMSKKDIASVSIDKKFSATMFISIARSSKDSIMVTDNGPLALVPNSKVDIELAIKPLIKKFNDNDLIENIKLVVRQLIQNKLSKGFKFIYNINIHIIK
ncbi:MAG: ribonuclease J [Alphaproteobacteria bacterium]|nr:ribonuclease J [Alphaproteobacteria bacterium]MBL0717658.1 ribonuclease J [Alphaproteobacteria bacterium]